MEYLRQATPPSRQQILEDLFATITLYENRAVSARCCPLKSGRYEVTLTIQCRKLRAGERGREREITMGDWVDVGVLDAEDNILYLEKHLIDATETTLTLLVDGLPQQAGIDPFVKLIDRNPDDNMVDVQEIHSNPESLSGNISVSIPGKPFVFHGGEFLAESLGMIRKSAGGPR
jgi:hypothetical protein